ncbi:MAG TPA: hypothetical protein VNX68_02560 [Nitrosopumilaceae archaeon]|jgi:hypothetical protein|nr:hypothetical protein [Nitrosopumilaceae archaeon]
MEFDREQQKILKYFYPRREEKITIGELIKKLEIGNTGSVTSLIGIDYLGVDYKSDIDLKLAIVYVGQGAIEYYERLTELMNDEIDKNRRQKLMDDKLELDLLEAQRKNRLFYPTLIIGCATGIISLIIQISDKYIHVQTNVIKPAMGKSISSESSNSKGNFSLSSQTDTLKQRSH